MIPTHPGAITPAWLEMALKAPKGSLRGFSPQQIGTGQMSKSYRLTLNWQGHDGPATVIAKCPALDPSTRAIAAALKCYTLELGWYRDLTHGIGVSCPRCLFLDSTADDQDFILLLEDLSPAKVGDQLAGASIAQIEAALREAARLHAPYWNDASVKSIEWLQPSENATGMIRMLLPSLYGQFRERYATRLAPDILAMGDTLVAKFPAYLAVAPAAQTVVHRDFRIDNILFAPGDTQAFIVDWQTLSIGAGPSDVAYLIGTSIADPKVRAAEEERLVRYYSDELARLGVACSAADIWREYRLYAFSGFIMAIIASMNVERTERGDEMFAVMAERPARQALHLGSLSLI